MRALKKITAAVLITTALLSLNSCGTTTYTTGVNYTNPYWAPPYHPGVRYYYLPDLEMYYDLSAQDFVYMVNGQWQFSPVLPAFCSSYDLANGFVVALNLNVFQPWVHHQTYAVHYPKYYYNNVYNNKNVTTVRGFDENERKPIYWKQEERERVNALPNRNNNNSPNNNNNNNFKRPETVNPPPKNNFDKKNVGKPVKVKPNMREGKRSGGENKKGK